MLDELLGKKIVADLRAQFVALGELVRFDDQFLQLRNADFHDLRDGQATREVYVAESHRTGIKRNRKKLLVVRAEVIAISLLEDVTDE